MSMSPEQIDAAVRQTLRDVIGLDPDPADPLHVKLMETVRALGSGATYGQRIVALRFDFAWELREAGKVFAEAKTAYEHQVAVKVVEEQARAAKDGRRQSLGLAEAIAEVAAYEAKLRYLLAEKREQSMRKFLDALDAALENHRTDRADARKVDQATSQGYAGGA